MTEFLFGLRPVQAALQARQRSLLTLYVDGGRRATASLVSLAHKAAVPVQRCDGARLEQLSKQAKHQGAVLKCLAKPVPDVGWCLCGLAALLLSFTSRVETLVAAPSTQQQLSKGTELTQERLASLDAHDVRSALEGWMVQAR